jgi:hypothetical protein
VEKERHGTEMNGVTWYIKKAMSKRQRKIENYKRFKAKQDDWKSRNLFVKNLHESIDETRLKILFGEYGNVESVKVSARDSITFDQTAVM